MPSDRPPLTIVPGSGGDVGLAEILRVIGNAEVNQRAGIHPTSGRVIEDPQTGDVYIGDGSAWQDADHDVGLDLSGLPGVQVVRSADDLPDPSGGFHQLTDETVYLFTDEIESSSGLQLASTSPVLGWHREKSWFVFTGTGTAIKGSDDVILSELGIAAPGETVFDIGGTTSSELLLQDLYIGVDDHLTVSGNIDDLGTIGTFRGPEMRVAGIRDFDSGFTFDGTYGRIYLETKVRDVTASNVTCFEFTSDVTMDSADIANCDFSSVQSDTVLFDVDASATINEIFNYRGNTHDNSVTKANILTGGADPQSEPYWVSDSHPLRGSTVVGELSLDSETETTISTQNAWVQVTGNTSQGNEAERTEAGSNSGQVKYIGSRDSNVQVVISVSFYGSNGDVCEFAIGKNGTVEPASKMSAEAKGQNANIGLSVSGVEDLTKNDTVSLLVRNTSGTNNVTVSAYTITFMGQ